MERLFSCVFVRKIWKNAALGASLLVHRDAAARPGLRRPPPTLCASLFPYRVLPGGVCIDPCHGRPCLFLCVGLVFRRVYRVPRLIVGRPKWRANSSTICSSRFVVVEEASCACNPGIGWMKFCRLFVFTHALISWQWTTPPTSLSLSCSETCCRWCGLWRATCPSSRKSWAGKRRPTTSVFFVLTVVVIGL